MKLIGAALCLAAAFAVGASAQTETKKYKNESDQGKAKTTRKIEIKDGTDVKVMGCLKANPDGSGYVLTNPDSDTLRYELVTNKNLGKLLAHRVEVKGKATDLGKGKVKVEQETKVNDAVGTSGTVKEKDEVNDRAALQLPLLGVKSVTSIADRCE